MAPIHDWKTPRHTDEFGDGREALRVDIARAFSQLPRSRREQAAIAADLADAVDARELVVDGVDVSSVYDGYGHAFDSDVAELLAPVFGVSSCLCYSGETGVPSIETLRPSRFRRDDEAQLFDGFVITAAP